MNLALTFEQLHHLLQTQNVGELKHLRLQLLWFFCFENWTFVKNETDLINFFLFSYYWLLKCYYFFSVHKLHKAKNPFRCKSKRVLSSLYLLLSLGFTNWVQQIRLLQRNASKFGLTVFCNYLKCIESCIVCMLFEFIKKKASLFRKLSYIILN